MQKKPSRILIVGATSGLGRRVAQTYINRGLTVGIAGRRTELLEELQALAPDRVFYQPIDITQEDATDKLQLLINEMGGIDTFFLASGIGKVNPVLELSEELAVAKTNVEGFLRIIIYIFNYFKQLPQGGHIAAITSIAGTKGIGISAAYSATKAFQDYYISSLSQLSTVNKHPIKFTSILPGFTSTDFLEFPNYPLQMTPEKVAKAIVRAIDKKQREVIIDWRYHCLVKIWKLLPVTLWEKMPIGRSFTKNKTKH